MANTACIVHWYFLDKIISYAFEKILNDFNEQLIRLLICSSNVIFYT